MKKQGVLRRIVTPILLLLAVMAASSLAYDTSRLIENTRWHGLAAHLSAALMFLSIWTGAFFADAIAFYNGAAFPERLFVCLFVPVVYAVKTWTSGLGLFTPGEMAFLALHHMVLGCPAVALLCMGMAEIGLRIRHRTKYGQGTIRIFGVGNTVVLLMGFSLTFAMLFNGGHTYYYLYMDVYTALFL